MELVIHRQATPDAGEVEVVERKGRGHPDTLCDAIAEHICRALCRHYRERFGTILHHNVDKVLLVGGSSRAELGGGSITRPIEIYLAGRATRVWRGEQVAVDEIALDACRSTLRALVPGLDVERDVVIVSRIASGSKDLTELFARAGAVPLANDTSCGAGFAPPSALERVVLAVDRSLAASALPALGSDTKVMGVRRGRHIELTIACAMISKHVPNLEAYVDAKSAVSDLASAAAGATTGLSTASVVNAADDERAGDIYLTVTGTSAEAGDDGQVGRGNRIGGLITPYRRMTLEAAAGKNPVSHVGKLYNVLAGRIAATIAERIPDVAGASCVMVGRIGHRIDDPSVIDVGVATERDLGDIRRTALDHVRAALAAHTALRDDLIAGRIELF